MKVFQLLPRAPGTMDGVGDYALKVAEGLREVHGIESVFLAHETPVAKEVDRFPIFSLSELERTRSEKSGLILHYVNYGFQKRGVPLSLPSLLEKFRGDRSARLLVIFHELYASGAPWRSEFWLQPVQKKIARDLARIADLSLVSCESMQRQLERLAPALKITIQPVTSTWGEPALDDAQLRGRDPHCWIICGGTALVERSVRSFLTRFDRIPSHCAPRKLFVVGGAPNPHIRALLNVPSPFTSEYFPAVTPEAAAAIFPEAAFAWLDYFASPRVPADVLLKSSTFLGLCAHGIVAVMPPVAGDIALGADKLPGPFLLSQPPENCGEIGSAIFRWYHRHASRALLTRTVAQQLQLV